jgi:putative endonuclease
MVHPNTNRRERGQAAENQACDYLLQQGLILVARNYRCLAGEIDLIFQDQNCLVFVEVRYRSSMQFGGAAESIDYRKQRKIARAASHYLQRYPSKHACRFDVIAIMPREVLWIRDAFEVE